MSLSTKNSNKTNSNKPKCSYCNKTGHLEAKCFKKYPNLAPNRSTKNINLVDKE